MWWLALLLALSLADAAKFSRKSSTRRFRTIPISETTNSETGKNNLEAQYDKITNDLLQSYAAAHFKNSARQKREISSNLKTTLLIDDSGVNRLQGVNPKLALCSPTLEIKFIDIGNDTFVICVSAQTGGIPATVSLGHLSAFKWTPLAQWYVQSPENVAAFYDKGLIYILLADSSKGDGTDLVWYNFTSQKYHVDHTVHSKFATAISIWKMKMDGTYHMAIANSAGNNNASDLSSEIYTYNWMGTYFDKYSSIVAYDVKDIEPFHIHGAAYLAVANYRRGKDNYDVDSEIFKYNLDEKRWLSHQKITTYGAMDWEFFSLGKSTGEEFFLAVANHKEYDNPSDEKPVNSIIYKFVKDKFVPFECLQTYGAISIAAVSKDSRFLLAIANQYEGVKLYQYDGWRFVAASQQYPLGTMSQGVKAVSFHHILDYGKRTLGLAVANPERHLTDPSVFEIIFKHENTLQEWHDNSTAWCMDALDSVENPKTETALNLMKNVFFVDQSEPIMLNGSVQFEKGLEAAKLTTPKLHDLNSDQVYDSSVLLKLKDLENRLILVSNKIKNIKEVLSKALRVKGSQNVTANYDFHDVTFQCQHQNCQFDDISTNKLNGENVGNLKENLIFLNEDQTITVPLYAEEIKADSVYVSGLVDGIDLKNVVTKSGNHVITGSKTFMNVIKAQNMEVSGLVDGVKISPQTVLLSTGYQNITGSLTFTDIDTKWLEVTGLLNGVNLQQFYKDLVLSDGNYVITGSKTFGDVVVNNLEMKPGSTINGIDLADLWSHILWKDGYQEITAPMNFSSITLKDLKVTHGINGILIPGPQVLLLHQNAVIPAPQVFSETAFISKLLVKNSINGIKVINAETGELDILLKTGDQIITGQKTFRTIQLDSNSIVEGTVDGIDLSEFQATALHRNNSVISNRTWEFNNLVIKGPLDIGGSISGVDLEDIYNRALKLSETVIPQFDTFIFNNIVHVEDLETDDINGMDVTRDLVLVNKPQVLTGVKTFHDIILEEDSSVIGLVNNVDISFLNDTLLRIGNQVITSHKKFNSNLKVKHLTVNGLVNNVNFDEIVTLNGNEVITGLKTFTNLTVHNLVAPYLEVDGLVNGVDMTKVMKDTMTLEGVQNVTGVKTVKGVISISKGSNLQTDSLNGIDISELWRDAVLVDKPQEISGAKMFSGSVSFDNLLFQESIDGVTEWDMKNNWMLQDTTQTIEGNVKFLGGLSANDLHVTGHINGINITQLNSTIVKINEPTVLEGPVIFDNEVISKGDVTLSGKIQGIDLSEEAVVKSKDNVITGIKTFTSDVTVDGDLTVYGLIDQVSANDICEKIVLLNLNQNITSLTVIGNVTFRDGGTVAGKLAGVDISSLHKTSVPVLGKETFFSGLKTFEHLTIEGPIKVEGKFGGIDVNHLNKTYMSVTRDQEITAPLHFDEIEVKGVLSAQNFHTGNQKVNDIDVKELDETILKTIGQQTVVANYSFNEVVFKDDVVVVGKVNGLEVPKGLMKRNRTNYIYSPKVFTKTIHVLGDLEMEHGKTVQGVDLSAWNERVVLKNFGKFEIEGLKSFNDLTVNDISVGGLVDGVRVAEDSLLMNYGDQVIGGNKVVHNNVVINGALTVRGLINKTDLHDLVNRAVRTDRNNTIVGLKTFKQPLEINTLDVGLINGVDIKDLQRKVNTEINFLPLEQRLEEMEDVILKMQEAFDKQAVLLQYYELVLALDIPGAYSWLYVSTVEDDELMLLSDFTSFDGCTNIKVFLFGPQYDEFELQQQDLISSSAVALKTLTIWDHTLLFVANQHPNPNCKIANPRFRTSGMNYGNTTSNIYSWNSDTGSFEPYQNLMMNPVTDLVAFVDGNKACLVYLELQDTVVYCARDILHDFILLEKLRTKGGRKATIVHNGNKIMLAIASVDVLQPSIQKSVDVYFWDSEKLSFGEPVQVIPSTYAQSVLFIQHSDGNSTETFLIIAEASVPGIGNVPRLFVYRYDGRGQTAFHKYQEIKENGELDWVTLPSGDLVFFVLDTRHQQIKIFQYKGASGFVKVDTVTSIGATSLHVFTRGNPEDSTNHYLALARPRSTVANAYEEQENAKILKSKMKGRRLPYWLN